MNGPYYAIEGVHRDEGTIVLFEGWAVDAHDPGCYLIAVEHRFAQDLVEALEAGEAPVVYAEPWQIVGTVR